MTVDELDQLLRDRFDLGRADLIAALKTLPAHRPWAATLTAGEARLLDDAGLTEDLGRQEESGDGGGVQTFCQQLREHSIEATDVLERAGDAAAGVKHELLIDGQPKSVKKWLLHGESEQPVLNLIDVGDWAST